jgi:hypothetical protein
VPQKTHTHIVNNSFQVEFVISYQLERKEQRQGDLEKSPLLACSVAAAPYSSKTSSF